MSRTPSQRRRVVGQNMGLRADSVAIAGAGLPTANGASLIKSLSQRSDHRSGSRRFDHAAKQSLSRRIAPYEPGAMRYPMAES